MSEAEIARPRAAADCTYQLSMALAWVTACEVCGRPRGEHADEYVPTGPFTSTTRPIAARADPT